MIVYVESNFVLEIALGQEQVTYAENILALAETGKIELTFPSFALSEPFTTIFNRRAERRRQYEAFLKILKQIKRSESLKQVVLDLESLITILKDTQRDDFKPLHTVIQRMLASGRVLETTLTNCKQAEIYEKDIDLSPQDSIIYASVVDDLKKRAKDETKCFLSRDKRAFPDDGETSETKDRVLSRSLIARELRGYGCKYFVTFDKGLEYIKFATNQAE